MTHPPLTQGALHIGLTVPDIAKSRAFFLETLGFTQVGEVDDYPAVSVTDGTTMITLWQAENPATAVAFDRKNVVGLNHLALVDDGPEALNALHAKLQTVDDKEIEFTPEPLGGGIATHMMCAIPGGIRTEFIAA